MSASGGVSSRRLSKAMYEESISPHRSADSGKADHPWSGVISQRVEKALTSCPTGDTLVLRWRPMTSSILPPTFRLTSHVSARLRGNVELVYRDTNYRKLSDT